MDRGEEQLAPVLELLVISGGLPNPNPLSREHVGVAPQGSPGAPSREEVHPVDSEHPTVGATGEERAVPNPNTDLRLEAQQQADRLSLQFPEALYELLLTLQEGRRINDQRCSFHLPGAPRRRCQSEPNATRPLRRVIFSSVTSLQQEEFFDQVALAQARRLDDQRSELQAPPISKMKGRSFRGSLKQLSILRKPPQPAPLPKEALYDMILNTQAQGRLEDQRSRAPGPMDDEDFFSLLLKVQGGRMEEQRTDFPQLLLQT